MRIKNLVCATVVAAFLALVVAAPQPAYAWGGCNNSYVVQWGDTLFSIGMRYGATVTEMRQANPNLGYWLYAGQTICIPDGYGHGYDGYHQGGYDGGHGYDGYQQGGYDGCGGYGCGQNGYQQGGYDGCASGCGQDGYHQQGGYDGCGYGGYGCQGGYQQGYDGYAPGYGGPDGCGQGCGGYGYQGYGGWDGGAYYTVQRGDTLAKIAARCGTSWYKLLAMNPGIWNPNWIYAGQVIRVR